MAIVAKMLHFRALFTTHRSGLVAYNLAKTRRLSAHNKFGVCFDIDGVLLRGKTPLPGVQEALSLLYHSNNNPAIPFVLVTNHACRTQDKVQEIKDILRVQVTPSQLVLAQSPLEVFTQYHRRHFLLLGQGPVKDMAHDLGFNNTCTIDEVSEAWPLLDVVDVTKKELVGQWEQNCQSLSRIEGICLFGEPVRWEQSLQIVVDLLRTDGKPDHRPDDSRGSHHLPVLACNVDLQFMHRAPSPRYGHGAYLVCLEALYKKVTGHDLEYSVLSGKPSEVTFRYAEHCLARHAATIGQPPPTKMYMIGDNADADIVGINLYQQYLDNYVSQKHTDNYLKSVTQVPKSRLPTGDAIFLPQTVTETEGILLKTGVYSEDTHTQQHAQRDFMNISVETRRPSVIVDNVLEAMRYIVSKESV